MTLTDFLETNPKSVIHFNNIFSNRWSLAAHSDYEFPFDFDIEGEVDSDGWWQWDGDQDLREWSNNSIGNIQVEANEAEYNSDVLNYFFFPEDSATEADEIDLDLIRHGASFCDVEESEVIEFLRANFDDRTEAKHRLARIRLIKAERELAA